MVKPQTDLGVGGARKPAADSWVTGSVLQTETGFVPLSDLLSRGNIQQVIVAEGLHAVVMPKHTEGQLSC